MAQLSDVPQVIRSVGLWNFSKRVFGEVGDDNLLAWAAALAYSWLFAIFPFLIFLLSLLPLLPEHTRKAVIDEVDVWGWYYLPQAAADTVIDNIKSIMAKPRGGLMSAGILLTLWGASGGMNMTITALERCYEIDRGRPFYKKRPLALGLTLIVAFLVITLLLLMPVGSVAIKLIEDFGWHYISAPLFWAWRILRYPMAVLVMFAVLNILYYYGPAIRQRFVFFTPGAVFCVVVWLLLAVAFRVYVDRFGKYNETYGTVGGVVILLLFFYVDAVVLLVGAEINSEIDFQVLGVQRGARDFRKVVVKGEEKEEGAVVANVEAAGAE